jgi:serine/threonine-protein kinase
MVVMERGIDTRTDASGSNQDTVRGGLAECPTCHTPTGGRPFCGRDGTLTSGGPFTIGGRYVVEGLLGSGGYALVFAATHQLLGKPVALKIPRADGQGDDVLVQRFLREARLASQLAHENIVGISDFGHDDQLGVPFLVMERLWGRTLQEVVRNDGPLPWRRALPILLQLARALGAAHAQKILHRDLKPQNIFLVDASGRRDLVKLCDFGLSRLLNDGEHLTATGAFLGTPAYMAPEQIRGQSVQDERIDLHAFGVTAYELLSGRLPREGRSPVAQIAAILNDQPLPLGGEAGGPEVPAGLAGLIMRCLATRPEERPASATEIEEALTRLAGSAGGGGIVADLRGTTVGSYRIGELIGSGGAGSVYAAEHTVIGTKAAIKVLLPEVAQLAGMSERFIEEARLASQLDSPHLPRYFDFGHLPSGQPYVVLELLDGETVSQYLTQRGPLAIEAAVIIARQTASVLSQAHAAGIVHRDIKPENLFWTRTATAAPVIKVLDFGIAKRVGGEPIAATAVGTFLGSPVYCAPEQIFGQPVGATADIYALGVTLFAMLAGRPPFAGDFTAIVAAKTSGQPPLTSNLRPDVPPELDALIAHMIERDPLQRPLTMEEVEQRLAAAILPAAEPPRLAAPYVEPAPAAVTTDLTARAAPPGRWRVVVATALTFLLASAAAWWILRAPPSVPAPATPRVTAPRQPVAAPRAAPPTLPVARPVPVAPPPVAAPSEPAVAPVKAAPSRRTRPHPVKAKPAVRQSGSAVIVDPFKDGT